MRRERGKEGEKGRKGKGERERLHLQEGVAPATLQYSLDLGQQGRVSTLRGQACRCLVSRDVCLHPRCRFCRGQGASGHVPEMPARGLQGQRLCCASPSCPYFAGATRGLIFLAPARRISYRNCRNPKWELKQVDACVKDSGLMLLNAMLGDCEREESGRSTMWVAGTHASEPHLSSQRAMRPDLSFSF